MFDFCAANWIVASASQPASQQRRRDRCRTRTHTHEFGGQLWPSTDRHLRARALAVACARFIAILRACQHQNGQRDLSSPTAASRKAADFDCTHTHTHKSLIISKSESESKSMCMSVSERSSSDLAATRTHRQACAGTGLLVNEYDRASWPTRVRESASFARPRTHANLAHDYLSPEDLSELDAWCFNFIRPPAAAFAYTKSFAAAAARKPLTNMIKSYATGYFASSSSSSSTRDQLKCISPEQNSSNHKLD